MLFDAVIGILWVSDIAVRYEHTIKQKMVLIPNHINRLLAIY